MFRRTVTIVALTAASALGATSLAFAQSTTEPAEPVTPDPIIIPQSTVSDSATFRGYSSATLPALPANATVSTDPKLNAAVHTDMTRIGKPVIERTIVVIRPTPEN